MEGQLAHLALVGQLPGCTRQGWGWHRQGYRAVQPHHRRLAEGLIDSLKGVAMGMKDLVESFGEVVPQVKAIGDLDCLGGALPGPVLEDPEGAARFVRFLKNPPPNFEVRLARFAGEQWEVAKDSRTVNWPEAKFS
jgi:hypothetical protein